MNLFPASSAKAKDAAKEMLQDGTTIKELEFFTVVRVDSPVYEEMKAKGKVLVSSFTLEDTTFGVFLN